MQKQLSIFDTIQLLDTALDKLKVGDFVKLRRKTASAAYWKKGEIVQIESVHPTNGSGRFWNERAECWGYLEPDDVTVTLPPRAIALDTESIPAPGEFDSVSGPVATYRPKGTARGGEYFRFSYRAGGKMKHLHIPGGNSDSILAQSRAAEVMELSAAGVPAADICDLIKSWSDRKKSL